MKLLVAIDLSAASQRVMDGARRMAATMEADVCVLHVADPEVDLTDVEAGPNDGRKRLATLLRKEHDLVQAHAGLLRGVGVAATGLLLKGKVVSTILEEADKLGADMIVIGSHGRGALFDMLVGSTSAALIRHSKIPVTIIPIHPGVAP